MMEGRVMEEGCGGRVMGEGDGGEGDGGEGDGRREKRRKGHQQGVVTYMPRVEAYATGIKIESSDQSTFWGPIKVTSKLLDQECATAI